jgi:hypothetical protein
VEPQDVALGKTEFPVCLRTLSHALLLTQLNGFHLTFEKCARQWRPKSISASRGNLRESGYGPIRKCSRSVPTSAYEGHSGKHLLTLSSSLHDPQRTLMGLHSTTSSTVGLAECRIHKETRDAAGRAGARSQGCLPGGRRFYRGRDRGLVACMVMLRKQWWFSMRMSHHIEHTYAQFLWCRREPWGSVQGGARVGNPLLPSQLHQRTAELIVF